MSKVIDWKNIGFSYKPIEKRFVAVCKNGVWSEGELTSDSNIVLNECAGVFQYAQTCFEGLKAKRSKSGKLVKVHLLSHTGISFHVFSFSYL